jgi:hypothetical protein
MSEPIFVDERAILSPEIMLHFKKRDLIVTRWMPQIPPQRLDGYDDVPDLSNLFWTPDYQDYSLEDLFELTNQVD